MSKNTQKLLKLVDLVGQQIHERVCDLGEIGDKVTLSQIKVLKLISTSEEVAMADIANHLKIKPASATALVDKMVQQNWIERTNDPSDRRKVYIQMSAEKKEDWAKMHTNEMKKMGEYMSVLSEEEQKQLIQILETLVQSHS